MPMAVNEEHGAQDPNNPYCIHCTDLNGKLLPFEKKFEDLVNMAMKTRWMSREEAEVGSFGDGPDACLEGQGFTGS